MSDHMPEREEDRRSQPEKDAQDAQDAEGARDDEARPEALLATLWAEIRTRRDRGEAPELVVLSMENYRRIQRYHAHLGSLPNADLDYISKYELFGLPIYIDDAVELEVR